MGKRLTGGGRWRRNSAAFRRTAHLKDPPPLDDLASELFYVGVQLDHSREPVRHAEPAVEGVEDLAEDGLAVGGAHGVEAASGALLAGGAEALGGFGRSGSSERGRNFGGGTGEGRGEEGGEKVDGGGGGGGRR